MPVPLLRWAIRRRHSAVDEKRGGRVVARHFSPQDVKSVRALLQKTINNMHNKYNQQCNYSGIIMTAASWEGKSKIEN